MAVPQTNDHSIADPVGAPPVQHRSPVGADQYIHPPRKIVFGHQLAFNLAPESVSAARCVHLLNRRMLSAVRKVYIPRDLKAEDQRSQFVLAAIDDLYHDLGGRHNTVALTIGGPETAYRRLVMPDVKQKALSAALSFEAKRQIPFPDGDCHLAHRSIAHTKAESSSKLKIALVAATRRLVAEQLAPFQSLGIKVDAVYLSIDVAGRLLAGLPDFSPEDNYCLVNIERARSEISYYRGTELEFSHVISLGSQFLANRRDETVFEYFAESLINELQNSLDFYSGQFTARPTSQVYIYGDLAYSDDLIDRLTGHFEFSFRRFPIESLKTFDYQSEDQLMQSPVCLPVVAAAVNNRTIPNLLPQELAVEHRSRAVDRWAVVATCFLALFLSTLWFWGLHKMDVQSARLTSLTAEIEQFRHSSLYSSYDSLKQQMALDQAYLTKTQPTPSVISAALKELSILTPGEIRLYDYTVNRNGDEKNGRLAGVVRSTAAPTELILAEFVERLRHSPAFAQVTVDSYQKRAAPAGWDLFFQMSMTEKL